MKNILSYKRGSLFSGKEILEWAYYQIKNNTSHKKQANMILKYFPNISPNHYYLIQTRYEGTGTNEIKYRIRLIKK